MSATQSASFARSARDYIHDGPVGYDGPGPGQEQDIRKTAVVESELSLLQDRLSHLEQSLLGLLGRLQPIMTPEQGDDVRRAVTGGEAGGAPAVSAISNRIRAISDQINTLGDKVCYAVVRLEI